MRYGNLILMLICLFSCKREQGDPIPIVFPALPSYSITNQSLLTQYEYSDNLLTRKFTQEYSILYEYLDGELTASKETGTRSNQLYFHDGNTKQINTYSSIYNEMDSLVLLKNSSPSSFSDSIHIHIRSDTILLVRNSSFASARFKTKHECILSANQLSLNRSSIQIYSSSQQRYIPFNSSNQNILTVTYQNSILVKMPRGILQDIFEMSGLVKSGDLYSQISNTELLFLDYKMPMRYPATVETETDRYSFTYTLNQFNIPEAASIQRTSKNISNQFYAPVVIHFYYPHD